MDGNQVLIRFWGWRWKIDDLEILWPLYICQ
jgi:hypothetical protein